MRQAERAVEVPALIVVRAGAVDRFAALQGAFASDGIDVVWDRRLSERRRVGTDSPPEPEHRRRGPAPVSWDLLDFLVVSTGPRAS